MRLLNDVLAGGRICWAIPLLAMGLFFAAGPAAAGTYVIDPEHTEVSFSWDHLGMSRQSGRFTKLSGVVEFDPTQPEASRVEVTIKAGSLLTGIEPLDKALRTADYFDVARFPDVTFVSTGVRAVTDRTGEVMGDLTIRGITRPVTLQVTWNFTGEYPLAQISPNFKGRIASGFSATTSLKRSEWGIDRSAPLISDEIRISIETEMFLK